MEGEQLHGDVSNADDRKLFIGGLHRDTDEEQLREYFGAYGEIEAIEVKRDPSTSVSRGFGFVTFKSTDALNQVEAAGDHIINGKKVDPKKAKGKLGKIFVGKLSPDLSDDDIETYFAQFGTIIETNIPYDNEKNQRKGFCFVVFESSEVVKNLLKSQHSIKGKDIDVQRSVPKPYQAGVPMRDSPAAFGGRGYRGGRGPMRGGRGAMMGSFDARGGVPSRRGGFVARGGPQTRGGWHEPMMDTFGARGGPRGRGGWQGGQREPMMESFETRGGHQPHGGWREERPVDSFNTRGGPQSFGRWQGESEEPTMDRFEARGGSTARGTRGGFRSRDTWQGGRVEPIADNFGNRGFGGSREDGGMMGARGGFGSRGGTQGGRGGQSMESFRGRGRGGDRASGGIGSRGFISRGGVQRGRGGSVASAFNSDQGQGFGNDGGFGQNGGSRFRGRGQRYQPY